MSHREVEGREGQYDTMNTLPLLGTSLHRNTAHMVQDHSTAPSLCLLSFSLRE